MVEARITETETGFRAVLTDGTKIVAATIPKLAWALFDYGIRADTAHCGDWREGEQAMTAGSAIALKVELRRLNSTKGPAL